MFSKASFFQGCQKSGLCGKDLIKVSCETSCHEPLNSLPATYTRIWSIFNEYQNDKRSMKLNLLSFGCYFLWPQSLSLFILHFKGDSKKNLYREGLKMCDLLVDFYQVCWHDAPGVKTGPAPGLGYNFEHGTWKKSFKIHLLWKWNAKNFDIWHVTSPSEPLMSFSMWCQWGQKWQTSKFFFSETGRCIALIFRMWHLLVNIYQAW